MTFDAAEGMVPAWQGSKVEFPDAFRVLGQPDLEQNVAIALRHRKRFWLLLGFGVVTLDGVALAERVCSDEV